MRKLTLSKLKFLFTLAVLLLSGAPSAAGLRVAIWGDENTRLTDVQSKISGAGSFAAVDVVNIVTQPMPSLAEALEYHSIMIFGGKEFWAVSGEAGDILADYADAGGGVVTCTFVLGSNSGRWILGGRFDDDRYHVMVPVQSQTSEHQTLGTVYHPAHPIMDGVNSFDGGSSSFRVPVTNLTTGSTLIADWSNGTPLVAVKDLLDMGRRVDLNFYPPSSDIIDDFWTVGTDGDILLANSLTWATPEPTTLLLLGLGGLMLRRKR